MHWYAFQASPKGECVGIPLLASGPKGRGLISSLLFLASRTKIVVARLKSAQRRKALEQIIGMYYQSGQALVRYVMLNRQCSEEVAYQRIATFVKERVLFDEHSSIDSMLAHDRQSLLDRALSILVHDPGEIDKI